MLVHTLDFIGASLSFLSTCCYIRLNKLAWPLSIAAIGIGLYLYSVKGLYSDVALHLVYLSMCLYGWHAWLHGGKNHAELPVVTLGLRQGLWLAVIGLAALAADATILKVYAHSQVPYWDATTTVISLMAQWMLCRKIIQSWYLWFVADALFAGMYLYKGLPSHSTLYAIYVGMAVFGYLTWKRRYLQAQALVDYAV